MTDTSSADEIHSVRLHDGSIDGALGTITGRLPLWFVQDGMAYIRTPGDDVRAAGLPTAAYRAVPPSAL